MHWKCLCTPCMLQGSEDKCGSFLCRKVFKGSQQRQQRQGHAVDQTDINALCQAELFNVVIFCMAILVKSKQSQKL